MFLGQSQPSVTRLSLYGTEGPGTQTYLGMIIVINKQIERAIAGPPCSIVVICKKYLPLAPGFDQYEYCTDHPS